MGVLPGSKSVDVRTMWQRLRAGLVDVAYPRTCAGCGSRGSWLCSYCVDSVPMLARHKCDRCGAPVLKRAGCWCSNMRPELEKARSVYPYTGWAANAVKSLKYRDEPDRARHLAPLMAPLATEMGAFTALVPVPLHRSRFDRRGFNQAALLADTIAESMALPVKHMLTRVTATTPQASLTLDQRRVNVGAAFELAPEWVPAATDRYLLIDDVRTSGATLNACAGILTKAGAQAVCALTFALDLQSRELGEVMAMYRAP